jgi:hypothetical protein
MAPAALKSWEAAIKAMQALGSNDIQVLDSSTPWLIVSDRSALEAFKALEGVKDMELQTNKNTWNKLLNSRVSPHNRLAEARLVQQVGCEGHYKIDGLSLKAHRSIGSVSPTRLIKLA